MSGKRGQTVAPTTRARIVAEVCDRLAHGESVAACFRDPSAEDWPDMPTFWRWLAGDEEFTSQYEAATVKRGEVYAEEIVDIVDNVSEPLLHPTTGEPVLRDGQPVMVVGRTSLEHAKLRADARKWVASRLIPKRFGDRTTLAGDADNPLSVEVADARAAILRGITPKPDPTGTDGTG